MTRASLVDSLLALLETYGKRNPSEKAVTDRFISFAKSGEILQGKSNPLRHITASTWIVNAQKTHALLTHHAKLGIWVQLGGHTDEGEDWAKAALREAHEESGISGLSLASGEIYDLDIHMIPARASEVAHEHYDLRFLVVADEQLPLIISDESHDLAWVDLSKLEQFTSEESQMRMRRKLKQGDII